MKKTILMVILVLLVVILAGCHRTNTPESKTETLKDVKTITVYANWAENYGGLLNENCLNISKMVYSDVPRLPLLKFESKAELEAFQKEYQDTFSMEYGYDEMPSFVDVVKSYDDTFFTNHTLFLAYKEAGSGSLRFTISDVKKENGTLIFIISQTNHPEVFTDDMSGWFLMAEIKNSDLSDVTSFDAQFPSGVSQTVIEDVDEDIIINTNVPSGNELKYQRRIDEFVHHTHYGESDYITIIAYTIEGDPITTTIKYGGQEVGYLVTTDTTEDKFGPQEIVEKEYDGGYQAVLEEEPLELMPGEVHDYTYWALKLVKEGEEEVYITTFRFPKESE